jgi:CelD/BcsL family acetyltransferase involved in cellulose biosynthesis
VQAIRFHHQVAGQPQFDASTTKTVSSPRVDLGDGWEAFLAERARAGVANFNSLPRKMRKLERELGPVRFAEHVVDDSVLTSLVAWKRAQYERTGAKGSMSHDWAVDAMRLLFAEQGEGFAGMLSGLYAGDRLIAAHAGMRSATAWHYWFPAYDPELANYSPGLVRMYEMCKWAATAGLHHIDLGPGEGAHKDLFGTSDVPVGIGQLQLPARTGFMSRLMNRLRHA